ncbi:MAG: hypothetical protein RXR10_08660 [Vulcanisaeta sp.]
MPSKAIGMGVCPRCGKPGTIVIKAGNYVYIKHGNAWHYIGTIDKVNLNKILIKNPENITTNKPKQKNKYTTIALITIATAIILGMIVLFTMYNKYMLGLGKDDLNNTKIIAIYTYCNYKNFAGNNTVMVSCNKTIYNTTVVSINITKDNVTSYDFKS